MQSELGQPNNKQSLDKKSNSSGLLSSSVIVGAMTMLSRFAGLARDVVLARFFGAGDSADAFFVAFKIPQFLRRLFAEGAFSQAFIPVLAEYKDDRDEQGELAAVKNLINAVAGVLSGVLLVLTLLVIVAAPWIAYIFAPGFSGIPEKFELTVSMLRITFPYLLLISLTGMAAGILNSYGRFWVPAITPVLLNASLITAALWWSPKLSEPVFALAWAVFIAGFAQLLFQLPFLAKINLLPKPVWDLQHPGVRKVLKLMVPALFGVSVSQINLLLDTVLASFLPAGSVSWLYYSDRLVELPLGVFGIAIATVMLPSLSSIHFSGSSADNHIARENFVSALDWSLRCIVVIALPATIGLFMLAEPILILLFQYQAMTPSDISMAALSLQAYSVGLFAFMAIKVLATGYYAQQDMKTPVRIGIIAMIANMVLNLIFVYIAHRFWQVGHVGLALATSFSACLNAWLLYRGLGSSKALKGSVRPLVSRPSLVIFAKVICAAFLMIVMLIFTQPSITHWLEAGFWQRLQGVCLLIVGAGFVYIAAAIVLGVRPAHFRFKMNTSDGARQNGEEHDGE